MKTFITILFALTFSTLAHADTIEGNTMSSTQKKILQTITNMTTAFQNGNIEEVMKSYEKDAIVMFEPNVSTSDTETLIAMFKGAAALKPSFEYSGHEVFVANDIAIHIAPWNMTATSPDGQKIKQDGLSVAVLRKQEDGEWRMIIDNPHGSNLLK